MTTRPYFCFCMCGQAAFFDGNSSLPKIIMKRLKKASGAVFRIEDFGITSSSELDSPEIQFRGSYVIYPSFSRTQQVRLSPQERQAWKVEILLNEFSVEWHNTLPKDDVFRITSCLSTKGFMGKDLCRDDSWIQASSAYTELVFSAGWELEQWPRWSRAIGHWYSPSCCTVRKGLAEAWRTGKLHLDRRRAYKAAALVFWDTEFIIGDSIECFEERMWRNLTQLASRVYRPHLPFTRLSTCSSRL